MSERNTILTITGSDSTGVSGVQSDILTIAELGGVAVSAITSITVQNTIGIQEFYDIPAEIVKGEIEAIINDVQPKVVKIGLIRSVEVLNVIVEVIKKYHPCYVIYDPIFVSIHGERLIGDDVVAQINKNLVPLCTLVVRERLSSHGENNAYSSAVAAYLATTDCSLEEAQAKAHSYVHDKVMREHRLKGRANELYHEFLQRVAQNCRHKSDVAQFADDLNVSPRYLAQVCKQVSGKTPKQILDENLIKNVERQLVSSDKTIQEIAYDFGFSSQAHLSKFFRNITGLTPTEYKRNKLL